MMGQNLISHFNAVCPRRHALSGSQGGLVGLLPLRAACPFKAVGVAES
jgi:hypothetical protein